MWTLNNISPSQYDEIYSGTTAIDIKYLFEDEPSSDADAIENYYPSKLWRLNSGIYKIENKIGELIPFEMNWAQHMVYAASLRHPRLIILKSRQQGISTFWLLYFFDGILVGDNTKYGLMAQGLKESKTLKERIELAWDELPEGLVAFLGLSIEKKNNDEFSLSNNSKIYIATSFRSGTLQGLHISEFGKISAKHPEKARETKTGSMQAIKGGLPVAIESTAEGRANMFYDQWVLAAGNRGGSLSPKDFMPVFLSWVDDPDCHIDIYQPSTREYDEYFEELALQYKKWSGEDLVLDNSQRWWWISQLREFTYDRDMMSQEYPGWPEEAFNATKDGTYYAKLYRETVELRGHIRPDLYDPALPVDVAIDLGMNDTMVLVFYQLNNNELRYIDCYYNNGEGILHYVNIMRSRNYRIRRCWLPHDALVTELGTGKSRFSIFKDLGIPARVLPKTKSVQNDIELVRKSIPFMYFDEANTLYLRQALENYSKKWDDNLGRFQDKPLHNEWSNPADAIRYSVIATYRSLRPTSGNIIERRSRNFSSNVIDGLAF